MRLGESFCRIDKFYQNKFICHEHICICACVFVYVVVRASRRRFSCNMLKTSPRSARHKSLSNCTAISASHGSSTPTNTCKRTISLCQQPVPRHARCKVASFPTRQHSRAHAKPTAQVNCTREIAVPSTVPVEYGSARARMLFQTVENSCSGSATVYAYNSPTCRRACGKNSLEDVRLIAPKGPMLRAPI